MHGLELGSLDLVDPLDTDGYAIRILAEGTTFGSPEAVVREIVSMLADGNQVAYDRAGNRVVSFLVEIAAADGLALAAGEAALRRELYRPNTVTWTPPAAFGPASVFEVLTSSMEPNFDDLDELRSRRVFQVTLTCAPFARSLDETITVPLPAPAPEVAPTTTLVDDCSSASGWSAMLGRASVAVSTTYTPGAVTVSRPYGDRVEKVTLTRAGSVSLTGATTPYLVVEATAGRDLSLTWEGDGGGFVRPISARMVESGWQEYVFYVNAAPTSLVFSTPLAVDQYELSIRNVARTDAGTLAGVSVRQSTRVIEPGGTERTPCAIHVTSSGGGWLGQTIVATWPERRAGFSPDMRQWRSAGNPVTVEDGTVSGFKEKIGGSPVSFLVPAASIPPGTYELVARLRRPTTTGLRSVYWEAYTAIDGELLPDKISDVRDVSFPVAGEWQIVSLGVMSLPVVASVAGDLAFGINDATSADVEYDELWLLPADDGCATTVVDARVPHLWLDSPSLESRVPQVFVGPTSDGAASYHPGSRLGAMGAHVLTPERTTMYVASAFSDYPVVTVRHYMRWHSNAGG